MAGARRFRSEKLREHQHREGYVKSLEGKGVEWGGDNNFEHIWEQATRAMVVSARLSESWRKEPNECVME